MIKKYEKDDIDQVILIWKSAAIKAHSFLKIDFSNMKRDYLENNI